MKEKLVVCFLRIFLLLVTEQKAKRLIELVKIGLVG